MKMTMKPALGLAMVVAAVWPVLATAQDTTVAVAPTTAASAPATAGVPALDNDEQKMDYALDLQIGRSLKNQGIDADSELFLRGLRDALAGRRPALSEQEVRRLMMAMRTEMRQTRIRSQAAVADDNFKAGQAFMAENGDRPGVVTLPSGLQYKVLAEGKGPKPADLDAVEVRYRGRLLDGREFDSSARNGDGPATFVVKASLPGWRQALQRMPVGSTWELYVPPRLAYGPRGNGINVGPQQTLVYEIELLGIRQTAQASNRKTD